MQATRIIGQGNGVTRHVLTITLSAIAIGAALTVAVPIGSAQRAVALMEPDEAQAELARATRESQRAEARAERLAREAEAATEAAEKTAREAAALAAKVQGAEADIAAARARYSLARSDRAALAARLAERQQPLVRLTGALQTTSRRPLALSALQPGSLKDLVYVRAVLDSAVPQIRERTAALRSELDEGRRLERRAARALENLRLNEQSLQARRQELAQLEATQRLESRKARSTASREAERALALAEEARDLDGLIGRIDAAASLRRELAALPGPILRPADLGSGDAGASLTAPDPKPAASPTTAATRPQDTSCQSRAERSQALASNAKAASERVASSSRLLLVHRSSPPRADGLHSPGPIAAMVESS